MSISFDGFVLRKPLVATSNSPFTSAPDTLVLDRDSDGNGTSDRDEYLAAYVNNSSAEDVEFLVVPVATSNIIVPEGVITETPENVDEDGYVYQFNLEGLAIKNISVSASRAFDYLDKDAGLIVYAEEDGGGNPLAAPSNVSVDYELERLSVYYTKNDDVTRFGFNDATSRWEPLPGSMPELLGELPPDGVMQLNVVEPDLGGPRVTIGDPDGTVIPVTLEFDDNNWPPTSINAGEAVALVSTGEIRFASDIISSDEGKNVYQFRQNFFPTDLSNGFIGVAPNGLFLNPIPDSTERPLLRSEFGSYMSVAPTTDPVGDEDVRWDPVTGALSFQTDNYDGEDIYYDGIYTTKDPIFPYESTDLGTISESFTTTSGISDIDGTEYDREELILYVKEDGIAIETVDFVDEFSAPFEIPANKVEAIYDEGTDQISLQLSFSFMSRFNGKTLAVGTGDYYLENGITFRMFRSLIDPTNSKSIPDARNRVRIVDEEIVDSIRPGPFTPISQIPLQDISGYRQNVFFRLQNGARRTTLEPNRDVVYDFNARQLRWTERVEDFGYDITSPSPSFKLDDEVLLDEDVEFTLDTGEGPEVLVPGEEVLIDYGLGQIDFATPQGRELYEGSGSITSGSDVLTANDLEFDFATDLGQSPSSLPDDEKPILILTDRSEAYRIVDATTDELTVHKDFSDTDSGIPFVVITPSEIVYDYSLQELNLNKRWIFPEKIVTIDSSSATGEYVPDGESYEFLVGGSTQTHTVLDPEQLGTLKDEDGNPNTLFLPSYYLANTANYTLYRESKALTEVTGTPSNPNEFSVDSGTGELEFYTPDVDAFPQAVILVDPQLSTGRTTGPIEVLSQNRTIGLPDDLLGTDIEVVVLLREGQYQVQPTGPTVFFEEVLRSGTRMRIRYFTDETTEITDSIGFRTRDDLSVSSSQTSATFGVGLNIDPQRPITLLVNGSPVASNADPTTGIISFDPIAANRKVQVDYYVEEALGGERIVTLLEEPYIPEVVFEEGSDQVFFGDHTDVLAPGTFLAVDDRGYDVATVSYNGSTEQTEVQLVPPVPEEISGPTVLGSTKPIDGTSNLSIPLDANSAGEQELRAFGNHVDNFDTNKILYLDGAPHRVQSAGFDESTNVTRITLEQELIREYSGPSISISDEPVYDPDPAVLSADFLAFAAQPSYLVRFDENDDGQSLELGVDYTLLEDGSVVLDEANTDLPGPGERWYLGYLGRRVVGPEDFRGRRIVPRLTATYTKFVNASTENGIENSRLLATYNFYSPDSFYFRSINLETLANEVAEDIDANAQSLSSSTGPTTSFGGGSENFEQGSESLIWEGGDLRDRDRVGRRFIEFYNKIAQGLESYLQTLDGRVVGDRDGQFKFFLAPDGQKGGEDPVTGELIPFYANPDGSGDRPDTTDIPDIPLLGQEGYIRNSIDDLILTNKKPFRLSLDPLLSIELLGTFKHAWEPHRLSRFYPQRSNVATITPPDSDNDQNYEFFEDFLGLLGDLKQDDIMSIQSLSTRSAKGWLITDEVGNNSGNATLEVGMVFELGESEASNGSSGSPNLGQGDPSNYIPGFQQGDLVNLGRVTYEENVNGEIERNVIVYARNMEIANTPAAGDDTIELTATSDPNDYEFVTDPAVLFGGSPAANYDGTVNGILPEKHDTLFVQSQDFFRQNFDYAIDASEGELVNLKLPQFLATIIGQNSPNPETYLEALITYKNQRTEPFRFPALDGSPEDDDNLTGTPYGYPIPDSESVSFGSEREAHGAVLDDTVEGIVQQVTVTNSYTLEFPIDLEDPLNTPVAPKPYDAVFIEGEDSDPAAWSEGSTPYFVSKASTTTLFLKAFVTEEASISYTATDAVTGTGTRTASTEWTDDATRDFTGLTGVSGTLNIGASSYTITSFNNGSVTTSTSISETSGSFSIDIDGTGLVDSDLHLFKDPSADFTVLDSGGTLDIASGLNAGQYEIVGGSSGAINVRVLPVSVTGAQTASISVSSSLTEGTGQRNGSNTSIWDDVSTDFTQWSGISNPYLHVITLNGSGEVSNVSSYEVIALNNGSVEVSGTISETSTLDYVFSTTSYYATGSAAGTSGDNRLLMELNPSNLNIKTGNVLVISSDQTNGGYYRVTDVNTTASPYPYIELDRNLRATEGSTTSPPDPGDTFPIRWYSYNPRRFSVELDDLQDALLQRRVIYEAVSDAPTSPVDIQNLLTSGGFEANNPSTPSIDVLDQLLIDLFGSPVSSGTDGEIVDLGGGNFSLDSTSSDFVADDVNDTEPASYVLIKDGDARGFYRVDTILSSTSIQLADGNEFGNFLAALSPESNLTFEIYNGTIFSDRTYELVLYEYFNVLDILDRLDAGILATIHDPYDFLVSDILTARPGDPTDTVHNLHISGSYSSRPLGIDDRKSWILTTPSLRDEIQAVLKGTENLYDLRYAWIDFRVNLEEGTLPLRNRFRDNVAKRRRKLIRELIKLETSQT